LISIDLMGAKGRKADESEPAPNVFVFEIDHSNNQIDSFLVKFQTYEFDARITVAIYAVDRNSLLDSPEWRPMNWIMDED
jgi:hypothetical protein